jgi:hypothetical protein
MFLVFLLSIELNAGLDFLACMGDKCERALVLPKGQVISKDLELGFPQT